MGTDKKFNSTMLDILKRNFFILIISDFIMKQSLFSLKSIFFIFKNKLA